MSLKNVKEVWNRFENEHPKILLAAKITATLSSSAIIFGVVPKLYENDIAIPQANLAYKELVKKSQLPVIAPDGSQLTLNCDKAGICSIKLDGTALKRIQKDAAAVQYGASSKNIKEVR